MDQVEDPAGGGTSRTRASRLRRGVLASVLALVLGAGTGLLVGQTAFRADEARAGVPGTAAERRVLLLTGGGVPVDAATLTALDATGNAVVAEGVGFRTGGPTLGQRVTQYLPDPDLALVVLQGGEVDVEPDPAQEARRGGMRVAALHGVDRIRAGAGSRTQVVLVGPVPDDGTPTGALLAVRDELRAAAIERGLPFLDPVALGWEAGQPDLDEQLVESLLPLVPQGS